MTERDSYAAPCRRVLAGTILLFSWTGLSPCHDQDASAQGQFVVVGSQFYTRDADDSGEARLCIQNTGSSALSMAQLKFRLMATKMAGANAQVLEQLCLYVKLSPPVLQPGRYGQVVAKLLDVPVKNCALTCVLASADGATSCTIPVARLPLWISYVGFSEDLRRVFVYARNDGAQPLQVRLTRVGQFDVAGRFRAVQNPIPPGDKGCLACDLPFPLTAGDFVDVILTSAIDEKPSEIDAVVRALDAFPIAEESGDVDGRLNLDGGIPFLQTMSCPAHAHGTYEEAAAKFLDDYATRFEHDPRQTIRMHICRSNAPRAWFRFGSLPDVASVNPYLRYSVRSGEIQEDGLCLFLHASDLAKRAVEPCRYMAVVPSGPHADGGSFLLNDLTPSDHRFLVYCALAAGAKGVLYRGMPDESALARDGSARLNRELQFLRPLLLVGEPVDWGLTDDNGYAVKTLLCGDQAILAVVFDRRYFSRERNHRLYTPPFGRALVPVKIRVRIPREVSVEQVRLLSTPLERKSWNYREGTLNFVANMVDSVQPYTIELRPQTKSMQTRGVSP